SKVGDRMSYNQLNDMQKKFVDAYMSSNNATQAAKIAGYSERSAHVQGPRLLSNDRVRKAIEEKRAELEADLRKLFAKDAIQARKVLVDILNDKKATHAVKLQAARDLLDRAGYRPTEKVE